MSDESKIEKLPTTDAEWRQYIENNPAVRDRLFTVPLDALVREIMSAKINELVDAVNIVNEAHDLICEQDAGLETNIEKIESKLREFVVGVVRDEVQKHRKGK